MNKLTENCIQNLIKLPSCKMTQPKSTVQIIEIKEDDLTHYQLTLSDGINFNRNFYIGNKIKLKLYDIIYLKLILPRSEGTKTNIYIFEIQSISNNQSMLGSPVEYPPTKEITLPNFSQAVKIETSQGSIVTVVKLNKSGSNYSQLSDKSKENINLSDKKIVLSNKNSIINSPFSMNLPGRSPSVKAIKKCYTPLNFLTANSEYTVKVRLMKHIEFNRFRLEIKLLDSAGNCGVLKIPNELFERFRNLKIFDVFEISKCYVSKVFKNKIPFFVLDANVHSVITRIDDDQEIPINEEDYTSINDLKISMSMKLYMLVYVCSAETTKCIDPEGRVYDKCSFILADESKAKILFEIAKEVLIFEVNQGDVLYFFSPKVTRLGNSIILYSHNQCIINLNPSTPSAKRLKNFVENYIDAYDNLTKNKIFKEATIRQYINTANSTNKNFLIKANISKILTTNTVDFACPKCSSVVNVQLKDYYCTKCVCVVKEPRMKLKMLLIIRDHTGSLEVDFNESERFINHMRSKTGYLPIRSEQLKKLVDNEEELFIMKRSVLKQNFFFKLNHYDLDPSKTKSKRSQGFKTFISEIIIVDSKKEAEKNLRSIKESLNSLNSISII